MQTITAEELASHLSDRSTRGIARDTTRLVRTGVLPLGARLPAMRDLAFIMGISPSTLSEAWKELRRMRILTGRGRNGTFVSGSHMAPRPSRGLAPQHLVPGPFNLSMAVPDQALLPPLGDALVHGTRSEGLNSYHRIRILPELEEVLRPSWPFACSSMLATNGGYNAVYLVLHALIAPKSAVAIEMPTPMRLLDILEDLGVVILPVACDQYGPDPQSLQEALAQKPSAFLFQPVLSSVTGYHCSSERLQALGDVLKDGDTLIIEDDGLGDISGAPSQSLGDRFPDRVIHIRSFSKAYGPDLRMAILSASEELVDQVQSYRAFSAGWTSRILQSAAAWLHRDAETQRSVALATDIYGKRRNGLAAALRNRAIDVPDGAGLSIFVPVQSENFAMITLAAHGVSVFPGEHFSLKPSGHIRIGTGLLGKSNTVRVAELLSLACAEPFQGAYPGCRPALGLVR